MLDYLAFRFPALARLMKHHQFWWSALALWFVVLFAASAQAGVMPPMLFTWQDKVQHAVYFCAGGLCFYFALRLMFPQMPITRVMAFAVIFCSVVGATDEFHQSFVPGRSGNDLGDWIADTVGGIIAAFIGRKIK